jgi:hypothetical protein
MKNLYLVLMVCLFMGCVEPTGEVSSAVESEGVPYDQDLFPRCHFYGDNGFTCCDGSYSYCTFCSGGSCTNYWEP